jgi:lysophospholipase L1-like esterase
MGLMGGGKEIIMIGDSLIEWFDWAERFPEHKIHNLGISGETVEMLLDRMPRVIERHPRADLVFIMTGINNVAMEDMGIIRPYHRVLDLIKEAYPDAEIYVHSLLPTLLPWTKDATIRNMNTFIEEMALETGVHYFDAYSLFKDRGVRECLLDDGVHISALGYNVWSAALEPIINA